MTDPATCLHNWFAVRPKGRPAKMMCTRCPTVRLMTHSELRAAERQEREAIEALENVHDRKTT